MIADLVLTRTVEIRSWRAVGQIATAARRAELVPMLTRIKERGASDARDIAEHLMFESKSRRVVAERMLRIATAYQLVKSTERGFTLTDDGRRVLDTREVFVPDRGCWTIWATDDPLVPSTVLHVEPWSEPSAYAEIWGDQKDAAEQRQFVRLPSWLRTTFGRAVTPAAGEGRTLRIDELEHEGEPVPPDAQLQLVWHPARTVLRLEGNVAGRRVLAELPAPSISESEVWRQLLEGEDLWHRWDDAHNALRLGFTETEEHERVPMTRSVKFGRPTFPDCGAFQAVTIPNVPIAAATDLDARNWAGWRLLNGIRGYATTPRFAAWRDDAAAPFVEFEVTLPERAELARLAWRKRGARPTPYVWNVVAAEDWRL